MLQTAAAAVIAWYLALLLLPDERPAFASIAAVISLGASYGQRGSRALQLSAGVVLGIAVADLIVQLIGTGPPQLGVMVLLAMLAARALGGGELLTTEAAVSAILLVTLDPSTGEGFSPNRMLEALIGGGVALAVSSMFFPPDPELEVGRAAQSVFTGLGRGLGLIARGLDTRDVSAVEEGLAEARALDSVVRHLEDELERARETLRLTPQRRTSREQLERYARSWAQIDLAVRDTRVLGRHAVRALRAGHEISPELPSAVRELELAVWELAAAYDDESRSESARRHAVAAGALAAHPRDSSPSATQVFGQVRSTAVDLRRAADAVAGGARPDTEQPTEELLVVG
jgi:uncharacterized membrane protein YgaE (UPF0421/DUF939 family)